MHVKLYALLLPPAKAIVKTLFHPKVQGLEHLPKTGPVILASNHLAAAETYIIPIMVPRQINWLGKSNLFTQKGYMGKLFAWLMRSVNVIPVDRSGAGKADAALKAGLEVLAKEEVLGLFPEGTRSPDGRLYKAKTGAVRLALLSKAPIIPVAVLGAYESKKEGSIFPKREPKITVALGPSYDVLQELLKLRADNADASDISQFSREELTKLSRILMMKIADISGQEYVDEYAADFKRRLKEQENSG